MNPPLERNEQRSTTSRWQLIETAVQARDLKADGTRADPERVALTRLSLGLMVVMLLAGCGAYGQLRDTVEALAPESADTIGKCQEYGAYVIDTPGYGCAYFVPGDRRAVSRSFAARLESEGFRAVCEEDPLSGTIDFQAKRGKTFVYAKVSRLGSMITTSGDQPLNIYKDARYSTEYLAAPPQHVIMKLLANDENRGLGGGTRACREYAGISR
jgi:hypothetical protein